MARLASHITAWTLAAAASTAPLLAQAPADPLAQVKLQRQLADQRAEAEVLELLRATDGLAKVSPTTAIKNLQKAQLGLDLSNEISSQKRKELVALLDSKIAAIQRPKAPATATTVDPKIAKIKEESRKTFEKYIEETKAVRDGITEIEKLTADNKPDDARRKTLELAAKYPQNPAVLVLVDQGSWKDRVDAAKLYAKTQDDRVRWQFNDLANSALPPKGDIEYPKNWAELTARRLKTEKLDEKTLEILKSLEKPVQKGVENLPFEETVQTLSTLIDQPLYLDKKSLEDAGLDMKRPVSMPGGVTAKFALRAVLQSNGLTYIIKDGTIQVVTVEQASKTLVTRAYYMGDALSGGPFNGAVRFGTALDYEQTMANAEQMISAITKSIDPNVWNSRENRGGAATIFFHYPSMSIIVRAPTEVHAMIAGKLR